MAPTWPDGLTVLCCWIALLTVRHGQAEPGQQVRLDPDPHRVVAGAEDARFADAGHAVERVEDVDVRVVGEEQRVVAVVRRHQRDDQHRQAGLLAHRQAELADLGRQVRLRLRHAVLDVDLIDVRVGVDVERDRQRHRAVVGVGRLHVEHVVDAVHLLLDRRRDRLLDGQRVRAGILRGDGDLRRHDRGELRDRQAVSATSPPSTVMIAMTIATIGRRMKKRDMSVPSVGGRGFGDSRRCRPRTVGASTITRSPGCRPSSTIQRLPTRGPSFTVRT